MQEQIGNVIREAESLRKDQKEIFEIKNTITKMKDVFNGLINRMDTAVKEKW